MVKLEMIVFLATASPRSIGVGAPRSRTSQGSELPSPRAISSRVHGDVSDPHTRYSLLLMQFSQITDHDLTFTPVNKGEDVP